MNTVLQKAIPSSLLPSADRETFKTTANTVSVFGGDDAMPELAAKIGRLGYEIVDARFGVPATGGVAAIVFASADPEFEATRMLARMQPVILIAENDSFEFRLRAARAGVEAIIWQPIETIELGARLSEFNPVDKPSYRVLIVDDDELATQTYSLALEAGGMKAHAISDPAGVTDAIDRLAPDLILLDMNMPGADGLEVARVIRQSRRHLSLPIVFLSAERDAARRHEARRIGGDDFISKPVNLDELAAVVEMRAERAYALRQIMDRDSLTGLLNHARFKHRVASEIDRSRRTDAPFCVAILDIDHFKAVNDTHGHQTGDRVIQMLAHTLTGALRRTDVVARYGGEEFAVLLLDTNLSNASAVIDKIRENFARLGFETPGAPFSVSFSAGVAQFNPDGHSTESLVRAADKALYKAKAAGRNRVVTG